jgi:hypothetical protein
MGQGIISASEQEVCPLPVGLDLAGEPVLHDGDPGFQRSPLIILAHAGISTMKPWDLDVTYTLEEAEHREEP